MLESLRRRLLASWKTKLAPLAEWLILAEPQLRLTDDMDGDAIRREVAVYVKRCVRWQAKERQAMQARRDRAQSKWGQKPEHRPTRVLFLGFIGFAFLVYVLFLTKWQLSANLKFWEASIAKWAEPSTLLGALAGAPVAFMIWRYRDQNTLWQIENQRKDINLKDFQKLAEWASGQHLQEDKVVEQTKRTEKATANGSEVTTETVTTREGSAPPDHARSVNKRTGGESLQVAAVYQLQAFLDGEFGQHFQRPTFHLLKSIWNGLIQSQLNIELDKITIYTPRDKSTKLILNYKEKMMNITSSPLGLAVNQLLAANAGQYLYQYHHDLPEAMLNGIRTDLPGLHPWKLAGIKLNGIKLQRADLRKINLTGSNLQDGKLRGIDLQNANLTGANLERGDFYNALLNGASLIGANLKATNLQRAYMSKTHLQGASMLFTFLEESFLIESNLRKADLRNANLEGANLQEVKLHGTDLRGVSINSTSRLIGAIYDRKTQFGRQKEKGNFWVDSDWIDAEAEEQRWRALGARRVDEEPTV